MVSNDDLHLCLECRGRLMALQRQQVENLSTAQDAFARQENHLLGMMEMTTGMPAGFFPRRSVRAAPMHVQTGPVVQHISIHDNNIGVLNTGTVEHLNTTIGTLQASGQPDFADALRQFADTVVNDDSLPEETRREILEGVEFVTQEAAAPEQQRRTGLLRSILTNTAQLASTVVAVDQAWHALEPHLRSLGL